MDFGTISMLVAGIALFLFGMMFFEETIHLALGSSIKNTIQRYAGSLLSNIGIGTVATGLLQSSTVVTMLMLGFVGANILNLTQGIGIVVGANIGTTLTPWLIALLGFKFKIEAVTLPIIALGGIFLIMGSRFPKLVMLSKFLLGFGLLFLGLGYMKESVDTLSSVFVLGAGSVNLWQSIGLGLLMTVILQTSTGTSVMTLTALSTQMITFDIALGMMIGANLGTAVTTFMVSFLSSTGKHRTKKVVALTHVLFNILTAILVLVFFRPLHRVLDVTGLTADPVIGLAAFHTAFNLIGVVCLGGFIPRYVAYVRKHKWDDQEDKTLFMIDQVATPMPEEYLVAMKKDVRDMGEDVIVLLQSMTASQKSNLLMTDTYTRIKDDCEEWMSKVLRYDVGSANVEQQRTMECYQLAVVGYLNAIKQLKDISLHYYYLRETNSSAVLQYVATFDEKINYLVEILRFVLTHGEVASRKKIEQGEQVLLFDDARFLKDIRASISAHNHDTENNHYRSQLLKTNRSVVLVTRSLLDSLISFTQS